MVLFFFLACILSGCIGAENLRGSHATRAYENAIADLFDLDRFENDTALESAVRDGRLVRIPNNRYVRWHKNLPAKYAYVLPHVRDWLLEKGRAFRNLHGKPITVTSAIRPKSYQERLAGRNANAAPTEGPFASTHSTGATIDLGYRGLSAKETAWLKKSSSRMEFDGRIQATMERYQACFHIMVYPPTKDAATSMKNVATP
jgi:hypothetical protein